MPNADTLFFFDQNPAALSLFEAFESRLLQSVGPFTVRVQKTQITYSNRHVFACISFLKVRKASQRPPVYLDSSRIEAAVEAYPGRWTHHLMITRPEDIDEELMSWIKEAYHFAAQK